MNQYQPSGAWGTCSPPATPAKSKMAARGPQNGQQCPLGFGRSRKLLLIIEVFFFIKNTSSMRKVDNGRGEEQENDDGNSGR